MDLLKSNLGYFFYENNICNSHGYDHAIKVMDNTINALKANEYKNYKLTDLVVIAGLLHDVDDKKFFPNNNNYENAEMLMLEAGYNKNEIDYVKYMINLVSVSTNKDNIEIQDLSLLKNLINNLGIDINDEDLKYIYEIHLYPRYADRLESIGLVGIKRCLQYTITLNRPLYTSNTLFSTDIDDIYKICTKDRYINYNGNSESMIDHFYDKLIHICDFPIKNVFLNEESKKRKGYIIGFIIYVSFLMKKKNCFTIDDVRFFYNELYHIELE